MRSLVQINHAVSTLRNKYIKKNLTELDLELVKAEKLILIEFVEEVENEVLRRYADSTLDIECSD